MSIDAKGFLEYLDKEMSIMGLLSAISIAAPAAILNVFLSDRTIPAAGTPVGPLLLGEPTIKNALWTSGSYFIVAGSALCVLAALRFYKQRSDLAWYYGQICLAEQLSPEKSRDAELRRWLRNADCWATWWPYDSGFTILFTAFVIYLMPFLLSFLPTCAQILRFACILGGIGVPAFLSLQHFVLHKFRYEEDYWDSFRDYVRNRFQRSFPHDGVFTRVEVSTVSGVGVFAIKDIPIGASIFEPDDAEIVTVDQKKLEGLAQPIRKLYEDFCVLKNTTYYCPRSFNDLTPSWYLNNSANPNVGADSSLKFFALREIHQGEELTANYETYSDNSGDF